MNKVHRFVYEYMFSFLLYKYLKVELLSHILNVCSFIRYCHILFQNGCTVLHSTGSVAGVPVALILSALRYCWSFYCSQFSGCEGLSFSPWFRFAFRLLLCY